MRKADSKNRRLMNALDQIGIHVNINRNSDKSFEFIVNGSIERHYKNRRSANQRLLKLYEKHASKIFMPDVIQVKARHMMTFKNKRQWVNAFPNSWTMRPNQESILFIDVEGNVLTQGLDFSLAEENNLFPVQVYWLGRVTHKFDKAYVDKLKEFLNINT